MGYLFGICVEKNAELTPKDPNRKYKGRVVFQGNRVVDQNNDAAILQYLGNMPATKWGLPKLPTPMGARRAMAYRSPTRSRRTFKPR